MNKDVNWISFIGPEDDGRIITSNDWVAPINPEIYTDLFKCSHVSDLTIRDLIIPGGSIEDSIDATRGNNYHWIDCLIYGSVTIKGAISGWTFTRCKIGGVIEVGQYDNYWRPGRAPTRAGLIDNCETVGSEAIHLKIWDGEVPQIIGTAATITKIPKIIWFPYFCYRYILYHVYEKRMLNA